ncbi:hypothetical protein SISNIDRAFT_480395 [Sistotremastrum niveocremeum HHB9708]|uniref:PRISE-like Rossmann-fold domain-containing protein n=1 Tax=Sistotremastrum niveocremeum HHB9708 TaxID=1314777 RepID=A0A165ACK6_9AGAM|nr:hypothetical protein SISNIDRAFT_480395 [Sistotremastrum niveocremeum HHB9708]
MSAKAGDLLASTTFPFMYDLQGCGAEFYGQVEFPPDPLMESTPRLPEPCASEVFGLYLSFYRAINDGGAEVLSPATNAAYKLMTTEVSTDTLAKYQLHLMLNDDNFLNGESECYNVCDKVASFETKWPAMTADFRLKCLPPK